MSMAMNEDASTQEKLTSNRIYEIIVVAIASAMMVVCGVIYLLLVMGRRWRICGISYRHPTEENLASNIDISRNSHDKISTIDLQGPVHIAYINEGSKAPSEIPLGRVQLSRDALLYISLITCLNLPDDMQSEESL